MQQRTQSELSLKIYICVSSSASTRARCRRCADDGRQLWNGCLDEDVLAPGPLGREMRMLRGLMLCCATDCVRMVDAKAVVGRRYALCVRCCF